MVVRVRVRLKRGPTEVVALAVANAGFESDEAEVAVPVKLARDLGLYPRLPSDTLIDEYRGAGGKRFKVYRVGRGLVQAWVEAEDRSVGPVVVALTIIPVRGRFC